MGRSSKHARLRKFSQLQQYSSRTSDTTSSVEDGHATAPGGPTLAANSQYLLRNGQPWLPVMGEFHYSRSPASSWATELAQMKAAGKSGARFLVIMGEDEWARGEVALEHWPGVHVAALRAAVGGEPCVERAKFFVEDVVVVCTPGVARDAAFGLMGLMGPITHPQHHHAARAGQHELRVGAPVRITGEPRHLAGAPLGEPDGEEAGPWPSDPRQREMEEGDRGRDVVADVRAEDVGIVTVDHRQRLVQALQRWRVPRLERR